MASPPGYILFLLQHPISPTPKPTQLLSSVPPRALLLSQPKHEGSNKLFACYPGMPRILPHYILTCSLACPCCYYCDTPMPFLRCKLLLKSDVQVNPLNKAPLSSCFPYRSLFELIFLNTHLPTHSTSCSLNEHSSWFLSLTQLTFFLLVFFLLSYSMLPGFSLY